MNAAVVLVLLLQSSSVSGWGRTGHSVTAAIANNLIGASTQTYVTEILEATNETLATVANWADSITKTESWSMPFHFINVQDCTGDVFNCTFSFDRDCEGGACVAGAVANYTKRLMSGEDVYESLKFVTHFAGDIHQPLHCAKADDLGGNMIKGIKYDVTDQGGEWDLHQVWDFGLIENHVQDVYNGDIDMFVQELTHMIEDGEYKSMVDGWLQCPDGRDTECTGLWGQESLDAALQSAYVDTSGALIVSGDAISEDYEAKRVEVVMQRLAAGGVRLASILDAAAN